MDLLLEHTYTLNPDGAGKVAMHWEGPLAPDGSADANGFLRSELSNAQGVEGWAQASCAPKDGHLHFDAIAYFASLETLKFHCQGFHTNVLDYGTSIDKKGNLTVAARGLPPGTAEPSTASDDELRARIAEEQEKFRQLRGFIGEMFGGLRVRSTFVLPGRVGAVKNATKVGDASVRTEFSGEEVLALIDRVVSDDALILKLLRSGGTEGPQALLGLLGDKGPLSVVTKGKLAPAFDYAEELAAAKKAFAEIMQDLGGAPTAAPGVQEGPPMTNVRVLGVKVVREANSERELNPLGQNFASVSLCIAGDLPSAALSLDEGRIDAVVTDDGSNLTPDDEWKRRISFPKLTSDRTTAFFDIDLPADREIGGFKEIRGALSCVISSGSSDLDLGFATLEPGATSDKLEASLPRVEPSGESETTLDLHVAVSRQNVESFALFNEAGEQMESTQTGYSSSSEESTLTYVVRGEWSGKGRIVLRVATELTRCSVPWSIENVDVLGRPRGGSAPAKVEKAGKKAKKGSKKK